VAADYDRQGDNPMTGSQPAGSTTSTKTVSPTGSIADYQQQGLNLSGNLYNASGGTTYSGLNGDQVSGLNEIARIANSGDQTANQFNDLAGRFAQGKYLNSNTANPGLQQIAGNSMNTDGWQAGLSGLASAANRDNPAFSGLLKTAGGAYLDPSTNPWLKGTYDQAFGNVQGSVGSAMAGAGRFGSGAQAGALTSGATNLANTLYGQQYANERQLQQQAQGKIGDLYNTGTGLGISAYADAGQLAAGDRSGVLSALGQLSGNYNAGLGATTQMAALAPALNANRYYDMKQLLGAGQAFQDDANAQIGGQYGALGKYLAAGQGLNPATVTSQSNPYFDSTTGNVLAGAGGITSLLAQMFGGRGTNGTGPSLASTLGSGASGLYASLFGNPAATGGSSIAGNTAASGTYAGTYGQDAYNQLFAQ
jgi:hypothetical protein